MPKKKTRNTPAAVTSCFACGADIHRDEVHLSVTLTAERYENDETGEYDMVVATLSAHEILVTCAPCAQRLDTDSLAELIRVTPGFVNPMDPDRGEAAEG